MKHPFRNWLKMAGVLIFGVTSTVGWAQTGKHPAIQEQGGKVLQPVAQRCLGRNRSHRLRSVAKNRTMFVQSIQSKLSGFFTPVAR